MLLLICLLLTALTATVSAGRTGENGLLDYNFKGRDITFVLSYDYVCENGDKTDDNFFTDKLNSVQARKADGKLVSIEEWKPGDTICANVTISGIYCKWGKEDGSTCGNKIDKTITTTVEFTGTDFCHLRRSSTNALTATKDHIRGDNTSDQLKFKFYCYYDSLYKLEQHKAGVPTCEEDGYDAVWYRCPLCNKTFSDDKGTTEITVTGKLGHNFNENGFCTRCNHQAEAYIYNPTAKEKSYRATATEAIADAGRGEAVIVVSYPADKKDPIILNKIVDLTVENGVTVPEIRLDTLSGQNTSAYSVNINNYGTVNLLSSVTEAQQSSPSIFIYNHNSIGKITVSNAQDIQILNDANQTIGEINIPHTDITSQQVQISNSGTITTLSGYTGNVKLYSAEGRYGTIQNKAGSADSLLGPKCYFYFPNDGKKWVNSNAGSTVSDVIVSFAPFTVKVNRDNTALTLSEDGSYTIDGVEVGTNVALSAAFTFNTSGLKVNDESEITSRWYYRGESKTTAEGKELKLDKIQYGEYDLIFEAKESRYGFTTSISVTVNVKPPKEKTKISLKTQLTSDSYTKVYDGTTNTKGILPPIEFQLADGREIRISSDYYTATVEYESPNCIPDNKIIVEVTLTAKGEQYYDLTNGRIEVPATITPYDGEWVGDEQYKAFYVGYNSSSGTPYVGDSVLNYLVLRAYLFDNQGNITSTILKPEDSSKDRFQFSFYHLRPGAAEPDPELDELLTADSVFTYPEEGYNFYAVVEPSLNYTGCITDSGAYFYVYDKYNGKSHTHDDLKTYNAWDGGRLSIKSGETAARYLSGAQPNVNVELALSQKKTLDLCLYNKSVHVIGSSFDQIYLTGGSTLVLSDCSKTGKVIGSAVKSGSGGVAHVKNGTLSIYDVTLTGGSASTGGAIVVDEKGVLNIYGGKISGNHVTNGKGGAIYIKSGGVVNMYGGTIQDNRVYSGDGGAIYVEAGGTLNLYGGTITGNTASGKGGGIYVEAGGKVTIQGNPVVTGNTAGGNPSNLYICVDSSNPLLTIAGQMTDGAQIGVSTADDAAYPVLLAGSEQDYSAYFIPDDASTFVFYTGQALTLCAKPTAKIEDGKLIITTGNGYLYNTFVLIAAEYDADNKMLAVHTWDVAPQNDTYDCDVNPGATVKCFLLRANSYTPVLAPFSPLA